MKKSIILFSFFVFTLFTFETFGQKKLLTNYDRFKDETTIETGWLLIKGGAFSKEAWFQDMAFALNMNAVIFHNGKTLTTDSRGGLVFILNLSAGEKRLGYSENLYFIINGKRYVLEPLKPTSNSVNFNDVAGDAIINAFSKYPNYPPNLVGRLAAAASFSVDQMTAYSPSLELLNALQSAEMVEAKIGDVEFKIKKDKLEKVKQISKYVTNVIKNAPVSDNSQSLQTKVEQTDQSLNSDASSNLSANTSATAQNYNSTALAYFQKGQYQEAYEYFNKAVIAEPRNAMYRYNLASSLISLRKFVEAEKEMLEAVQLNPENQTYQIGLGIARQNLKNFRGY